MVTSLLTATYMFRLVFLAFHGERRVGAQASAHPEEAEPAAHGGHGAHASHDAHGHGHAPHDAPPSMAIPLILLAIGSVVAGYVGVPHAIGGNNRIERFLEPSFEVSDRGGRLEAAAPAAAEGGQVRPVAVQETHAVDSEAHDDSATELKLMALSSGVAIAGILIAMYFWLRNRPAADAMSRRLHGVYTLLETVRALKIPRLLHISTDEVYGSIADGAASESAPVAPTSPYSAAKAAGDLLALAYVHTHQTPVVITRSSNNFGPYQYPEKVIPLFVTNAIDDEALPLYGDGRNVRDWLYVLDNCAAIDLVLRRGATGEVYNIGGGHEVENVVLTREILKFTGKPETLIRRVKDRPGHDRRYSVDARKVRALGWAPRQPFAEALAATVEWYRRHEAWWRPLKSGEFKAYYQQQYAGR